MNVKRWIAGASVAAAMTSGALAVTAAPASASPLSTIRNGCVNDGGIWFDDPDYTIRYSCVYWYPTSWTIFFFRSNGMYVGLNAGTGPVNFNPNQVQRP
jgi:hypothetical protein